MWAYIAECISKDEHDGRKIISFYHPTQFENEEQMKGVKAKTVNILHEELIDYPPTKEVHDRIQAKLKATASDEKALEFTKEYTRIIRDRTYSSPPTTSHTRFLFFKVQNKIHRAPVKVYLKLITLVSDIQLLSDEELLKIENINDEMYSSIVLNDGRIFTLESNFYQRL